MDLGSKDSSIHSAACPSKVSSKMKLKEGANSSGKSKGSVKSKTRAGAKKTKVHVNGTTCSTATEKHNDKACDKDNSAPQTCQDAVAMAPPKETSVKDKKRFQLIHRMEVLDLGSDTPNEDATHNGSHLSNGLTNGSLTASSPVEIAVHSHDSVPDKEKEHISNKESTCNGTNKEEVTDLQSASPDSGLSTESQDRYSACSPLSNPSSDDTGEKSTLSCGSTDETLRDFNENVVNGQTSELQVAVVDEGDNAVEIFEFEIPQELCGLLIGRNGRYVKYIKEETNADILIKHHIYYTNMKSCIVTGKKSEIVHALQLIRDRFPEEKYPEMSLACTSFFQRGGCLPISMRISVPPGIYFEAIVSAIISPSYFFVHQPTHPTYHTLSYISHAMSNFYSAQETPQVIEFKEGYIVAIPFGKAWYRAEIMEIRQDKTANVKLLDFGGFMEVKFEDMRQLSYEFLAFPFQASECYMSNITYLEGKDEWSNEALEAFEELSQGQVLQGYITGYHDNGTPYVHLFKVEGNHACCINEELVRLGHAKWLEVKETEEEEAEE